MNLPVKLTATGYVPRARDTEFIWIRRLLYFYGVQSSPSPSKPISSVRFVLTQHGPRVEGSPILRGKPVPLAQLRHQRQKRIQAWRASSHAHSRPHRNTTVRINSYTAPLKRSYRKTVCFFSIICSRCCMQRNLCFLVENCQHADR